MAGAIAGLGRAATLPQHPHMRVAALQTAALAGAGGAGKQAGGAAL